VFEQECGVGAVESHGALKASTGMGCWFVLWRRDAGGRFAGEEFGDGVDGVALEMTGGEERSLHCASAEGADAPVRMTDYEGRLAGKQKGRLDCSRRPFVF
jgi:hypothetical protein